MSAAVADSRSLRELASTPASAARWRICRCTAAKVVGVAQFVRQEHSMRGRWRAAHKHGEDAVGGQRPREEGAGPEDGGESGGGAADDLRVSRDADAEHSLLPRSVSVLVQELV